jgi:hypothetical protein
LVLLINDCIYVCDFPSSFFTTLQGKDGKKGNVPFEAPTEVNEGSMSAFLSQFEQKLEDVMKQAKKKDLDID